MAIGRLAPLCLLSVTLLVGVPFSAATAAEPIDGLGDTLQFLIPATGYAATWLLDDEEGREQFYWAYGTSLAVTYALKYSVGEHRPNGSSNTLSFPSGHTSSAFQGASFIQQRYGWRYGLPAYLGAAYTGWSRVELGKHYPHDVFAGAAVGILSSYIFTTPYDADRSVQLFYEEDTIGLQINWTW